MVICCGLSIRSGTGKKPVGSSRTADVKSGTGEMSVGFNDGHVDVFSRLGEEVRVADGTSGHAVETCADDGRMPGGHQRGTARGEHFFFAARCRQKSKGNDSNKRLVLKLVTDDRERKREG